MSNDPTITFLDKYRQKLHKTKMQRKITEMILSFVICDEKKLHELTIITNRRKNMYYVIYLNKKQLLLYIVRYE